MNVKKDNLIYSIYCITSPSGKKYVGLSYNPEKRWCDHVKNAHYASQPLTLLGKAILKYGENNFTHEILKSGLIKDAAINCEKYFINKYKTLTPYGYNQTAGGEGLLDASPEIRQKISCGSKKYHNSPEAIERMTGANNPMRNPDVVAKLSGDNNPMKNPEVAAKLRGDNHPMSKSVLQYDMRGYFVKRWDSVMDISRDVPNVQRSHITQCCNGKRIQHHNYIWRWETSSEILEQIEVPERKENPMKNPEIAKKITGAKHGRSRKVNQYSLDGVFIQSWGSISEAEATVGKISRNISSVCNGKQKTAYGFIWKYVDKSDEFRVKNDF